MQHTVLAILAAMLRVRIEGSERVVAAVEVLLWLFSQLWLPTFVEPALPLDCVEDSPVTQLHRVDLLHVVAVRLLRFGATLRIRTNCSPLALRR